MTHVARLRLKNVGPYAGEHVLELGPCAYAVTATRDDDPERSNGAGKTTLVSAIRLALYGAHWARLEDGWLTNGEPVGEVELTMSDGSRVLRSRHRGKSTRLYFWEPGKPADSPATQAEAQRLIEERVGLSQSDFDATCFFEQKRMSRMVVATPEERMLIVAGWLALAPLQRAEDACRARLARVNDAAESIGKRVELLIAQRAEILGIDPGGETRGAGVRAAVMVHKGRVPELTEKAETAKALKLAADEAVRETVSLAESFAAADRASEVIEEGKRLVKESPTDDLESKRKALMKSMACQEVARAAVRSLSVVAAGEFDGACPVVKIKCPAAKTINAMRDESAESLRKVRAELRAADEKSEKLEREVSAMEASVSRIERLRGEAKVLQKAAKRVEGMDRAEIDKKLQHQRAEAAKREAEWTAAADVLARAKSDAERLTKIEEELARLEDEARERAAVVATHQEAMVIFGKNGAQRRVAESALARIEQAANGELEAAGLDLRIAVLWSREGQGLAASCDACGSPFPSSVKVKQCVRCGADRGPKIINRLEIEPSSRSGGLDDLAGIYFQIAAASWLRQARGCQWASAVIDEPTGALDRASQRAVGRHVAATLSGLGFEQSFVIAHHPGVLDMLPGRIEVTSRNGRASVAVVA